MDVRQITRCLSLKFTNDVRVGLIFSRHLYVDGLVQEIRNSSALAME